MNRVINILNIFIIVPLILIVSRQKSLDKNILRMINSIQSLLVEVEHQSLLEDMNLTEELS